MTPLLECRDFSFCYGERKALDKITFRIFPGERLFILGANGSGKSTLLKNMLRLLHGRVTGEILVGGRSVSQYARKDLARLMAWVPQAGGHVPPFTVRDFLALSRYPYGWHGRDAGHCESISRALRLTNMEDLASRRLDQLSGGQRQRAYLAAAIAQDAGILLLDEPDSFLDPNHVSVMRELLRTLNEDEGISIITITHDLSEPLATSAKALVLRAGRQLHFGDAADLVGNGILERAFDHAFSYLTHPRTGKTIVVP